MRIKFPSFPICLFAAIAAAVLVLPGCGQTPSSPPSTKPGPVSTPKTASTPVVDPNAPPAAYKLSNLIAEPVLNGGANEYYFYVDVENTGGQSGTFIATYRIDNDAVKNESKKLNLDPGKKKQLQLIGPQQEIIILGKAYDGGMMEERQHVVYCGDLVLPITITLAERPALLLITRSDNAVGGNITITGEVKNISNNTIERVIAVVDIRITDQKIIWIFKSPEAQVEYQPLMPDKTTPFTVITPDNIPNNLEYYDYRVTFKDAAGVSIRSVSGETQ